MTLTLISVMAVASVAAFLITLARVTSWSWILRNATVLDVVFTALIGVIMGFTITGMLIAILAGLCMAVVLTIAKKLQCGLDTLGKQIKREHDTDSEFDSKGRWVYNTGPYVGE